MPKQRQESMIPLKHLNNKNMKEKQRCANGQNKEGML